MVPIERYTSIKDSGDERPGQISFDELCRIVEKVSEKHGLLQIDDGDDEQTDQRFRIFTIGRNENEAQPVVLIGNQTDISDELSDVGSDWRPHKLIAPQYIIDEVTLEIEQIREATKFATADPIT